MIKYKTDSDYLRLIASLKWTLEDEENERLFIQFNCRKSGCGSSECYWDKVTWKSTCKKCHTKESAIANTAFEGLKIPITTAINILEAIQQRVMKSLQDPDYVIRLPLSEIAEKFKLEKSSVAKFLKRTVEYIEGNGNNSGELEFFFVQGLKSLKSIKNYESLYFLLFEDDEVPREIEEIIYFIASKSFNYLDLNFYDVVLLPKK